MKNFIKKQLLKAYREAQFLSQQKWGILPSADKASVPKYRIKKYLGKDPVIIDCGAHFGSDSVELSRVFPKGQVHSFEPLSDIYRTLTRNTGNLPNITTHNVALSNISGKAIMHKSSGASDASSSLLIPTGHLNNYPEVAFSEQEEVQTITLDEWARLNKIDHVDFLWLDMQGFEFKMLEASTKIFPTVKVLYTEVSSKELYAGAMVYGKFRFWLEERGFKMIEEFPDPIDPCNVLFVKQ